MLDAALSDLEDKAGELAPGKKPALTRTPVGCPGYYCGDLIDRRMPAPPGDQVAGMWRSIWCEANLALHIGGLFGEAVTMGIVDPAWPLHTTEPTVDTEGDPVWVAADESGASGENLIDPGSVFSHASVRIDDATADPILREIRAETGANQASEVKFARFASSSRRLAALARLFAADGPLAGRVTIAVADKRYMIVSKMIDLLVEELAYERGIDMYSDGSARQMAVTLFSEGPRALGELWDPLAAAFVSLARTTERGTRERETVDRFFERLQEARWRARRRTVERILIELLDTRSHAEDLVLSRTRRDSPLFPGLDPLVAMLPLTVGYAYADHGPVRFLHDQQNIFTPEFVRDFFNACWHLPPEFLRRQSRARVAEFWTGRSHLHPSIQLADLAASAGRVVAEAWLGRPSLAADALMESVSPLIRDQMMADEHGPGQVPTQR